MFFDKASLITLSAHFIAYLPSAHLASTLNSSVTTVFPSAAATEAEPALPNRITFSSRFELTFASYASDLADTPTSLMSFDAELIANCAPAIAIAALSASSTTALSFTVSPGFAVSFPRTHLILPFCSSLLLTVIEPSVNLTLEVMFLARPSLTTCSAHLTSYLPAGQSVGTVYVSVMISALSAATTPSLATFEKRNAGFSPSALTSIFASYAPPSLTESNFTAVPASITN